MPRKLVDTMTPVELKERLKALRIQVQQDDEYPYALYVDQLEDVCHQFALDTFFGDNL